MGKPSLLVLAAGMGSRYGGLKQIDPVGADGEFIIDYSIYDAIRAGFGKVVFVIRREIEREFRQAIGERFQDRIKVGYAYQELDGMPDGYAIPERRIKPWGTAHAVLSAKDVINEPFGVINADDFYGAGGYQLLFDHLSTPTDTLQPALISFTLRNTLSEHGGVARSVCRCSRDGFLEKITEYLEIEPGGNGAIDRDTGTVFTANEQVSMNMWGFGPGFFTVLETDFAAFLDENLTAPRSEYQIPTVVDKRIQSAAARVKVLPSADTWFGVTYPGDKPRAVQCLSKLIRRRLYPAPLWK
jgi:hypothetical protein